MANEPAPLTRKLTADVPAVTIAADNEHDIGQAPFAATVSAVTYIPESTITGANTNSRTVVLVNKGAAGSGTTVVATLAFTSGVNATGDAPNTITLSAVSGATTVASGDVLAWQSTHVGTGIADPGGVVTVEFTRSAGS